MTVFIGVPNVMFSCQLYTNWSTILEHTNWVSVVTMDIYFNNNKQRLQGSGDKESPEKVNKCKAQAEKDTEY
jgi:hypothetical protein